MAPAGGVSLGLAVAAKLYPVALAPIFIAWYVARGERRAAIVFGVAAAVAALAATVPIAAFAPGEFLSFFRYHAARGLQIESVPAGLMMLGHVAGAWHVQVVENFGALHLAGTQGASVQHVLAGLLAGALIGVGGLALARFRRERAGCGTTRDETLAGFLLAALLASLVVGKVFSPQFIAWLLPFAPLAGSRKAALAVLAGALTSALFPFHYDGLMHLEAPAVVLLDVRNLVVVLLLTWLLRSLRPAAVPEQAEN